MKYECKIDDPIDKMQQMILEGYLCEGTFKEQLMSFTLPELKEIAVANGLPKGKKKQDIVDLISEKCTAEQLQIKPLIKITEKGIQYLRDNRIYAEDDPTIIEPYIIVNEQNEITGFDLKKYIKENDANTNSFNLINSKAINCISSLGFCHDDFSVYNAPNTLEFKRYLKIVLLWGEVKGKSEVDMAHAIKGKYPIDTTVARMLIRTESNYFVNQAELKDLQDAGYDEYQFMALRAENGCEHCNTLNGKIFKIEDAVVGVNFPPMHIGCRCKVTTREETLEEIQADIDRILEGTSIEELERKLDEMIAEKEKSEHISTITCPFCSSVFNAAIIVKFCPKCGKVIK